MQWVSSATDENLQFQRSNFMFFLLPAGRSWARFHSLCAHAGAVRYRVLKDGKELACGVNVIRLQFHLQSR